MDIGARIGKKRLTPHDIRHVFGSYYCDANDIIKTRDALGHKHISSTERYLDSPKKIKESHKKFMDEILV